MSRKTGFSDSNDDADIIISDDDSSDIDDNLHTNTNKQSIPYSQLPWIEKYRPKELSSVSHQDETINVLKRSIKTGNLPHLLFYGPPGMDVTKHIINHIVLISLV